MFIVFAKLYFCAFIAFIWLKIHMQQRIAGPSHWIVISERMCERLCAWVCVFVTTDKFRFDVVVPLASIDIFGIRSTQMDKLNGRKMKTAEQNNQVKHGWHCGTTTLYLSCGNIEFGKFLLLTTNWIFTIHNLTTGPWNYVRRFWWIKVYCRTTKCVMFFSIPVEWIGATLSISSHTTSNKSEKFEWLNDLAFSDNFIGEWFTR